MLLHRHTLCPNGHIVTAQTELETVTPDIVEKYAPLFRTADKLSAQGPTPTAPEIIFEWLGTPSGQAKFACCYRGNVVWRVTFVSGRDAKLDTGALRILARDLSGRKVLEKPPEEWPPPLKKLIGYQARPVLIGAVWPEIPPEELEKIASLDIVLAAVFVHHLGVSEQRQAELAAAPDPPT